MRPAVMRPMVMRPTVMRPIMRLATRLRDAFDLRVAAWVRRRQGSDAPPFEVTSRRLYILPTRAGLGFGVLLFLMLLAGLNYANSLALFTTFLLAGVALSAMHLCHRNLLGARLTAMRSEPAFAEGTASVEAVVENVSTVARHAWSIEAFDRESVARNVDPRGFVTLQVPVPVTRRGVLDVTRVRLSTTYPFGLFRAWTWIHVPLELVVYPHAKGALAPRTARGTSGGAQYAAIPGDDEWESLRAYREGDSPRKVAWKAFARGGPLLVKEYAAEAGADHLFSYDRIRGLDRERRLQQLCRWIVDAEQRGERYGLELPGWRLPPASGALHRQRALEALGRFEGARSAVAERA